MAMEDAQDVRHLQFCTKSYRYHARIGPVSPVSQEPCTQQNNFCNHAAFHEDRRHPVFLAPLCAEGCRDDLS